jgi:hypothetical protein
MRPFSSPGLQAGAGWAEARNAADYRAFLIVLAADHFTPPDNARRNLLQLVAAQFQL